MLNATMYTDHTNKGAGPVIVTASSSEKRPWVLDQFWLRAETGADGKQKIKLLAPDMLPAGSAWAKGEFTVSETFTASDGYSLTSDSNPLDGNEMTHVDVEWALPNGPKSVRLLKTVAAEDWETLQHFTKLLGSAN